MIRKIIKKSFLYKIYLRIRYPEILENLNKQIAFISKLIPEKCLCFDIGANVGNITSLLLYKNAKVIALEPDITNYNILELKFKNNNNVQLVKKAVDFEIAKKEFFIIENDRAFNTLSKKWRDVLGDSSKNRWKQERKLEKTIIVQTTTLDLLIKQYGIPYYIKIDVEGFELNVIQGLSHSIPLISIEANLPEFTGETIKCIELLCSLNKEYTFNISSDNINFHFPNWINQNKIINFVSTTKIKYFELYCKS